MSGLGPARTAEESPARARRPPVTCPVCGGRLVVRGLGCDECGTELSGRFAPCDFCGLGDEDRDLLRVFLTARGNMKELERHLGVSYPTARARFDSILGRLGLTPAGPIAEPGGTAEGRADRARVLRDVAAGAVAVDDAFDQLR